jgi:hypothetical protein
MRSRSRLFGCITSESVEKFFSFLNRDSDFGRATDALRRIVSVLIAVDRLAASLQPIQDTHLKTKGDLKTTKQQLVKFST